MQVKRTWMSSHTAAHVQVGCFERTRDHSSFIHTKPVDLMAIELRLDICETACLLVKMIIA